MVNYKILQKARDITRVCFGESHTYDWGFNLVNKYQDPFVWCYAVMIFLADWNRIYYKGKDVGNVITDTIEKLCPLFMELKATILKLRNLKLDELQELELENLKPIIVCLFDKTAETVGSTGASKALHILVPSLFMMWDNSIREHYGLKSDAISYFEFLKKMRLELREAVESYSKDRGINNYSKAREELEKELDKPLLKVMDEYNWLAFTRGYKFG